MNYQDLVAEVVRLPTVTKSHDFCYRQVASGELQKESQHP